jgi:murein tripeptide amidase MpaA
MMEHKTFNDDLINYILISRRPNVHHLLYDEVIGLVYQLHNDFESICEIEKIGKTHENRDIIMLKFDAAKERNNKAILMTGAHHARELISVQMPLFSIL